MEAGTREATKSALDSVPGGSAASPTQAASLLVRFCTLCAGQIPEVRAARNSHTCSVEHQREERRQRRAFKATKACRLCGRSAKVKPMVKPQLENL
jgi:hypothetical protein